MSLENLILPRIAHRRKCAMPKSDRPKLSLTTDYHIEQTQNQIHSTFLAELTLMQANQDGLLIERPSGIYSQSRRIHKSPHELRFKLAQYSQLLFNAEASRYQNSASLSRWLRALKERIIEMIFAKVAEIENLHFPYTLKYHELSGVEMREAMAEGIHDSMNSILAAQKQPSMDEKSAKATRASSAVASPTAARKVEEYIAKKGLGMTEFAIQAGTTDRTLRSFRKTGRIRRSLLEGIAKAMGTTKEKLLSD